MHTPTLSILGALLAGVHQTYARVNCYTGGRDFQASADSLRTTFRQVCQDNFSLFPTSQSAALGCYNYDSVSKINFLVRYEGPNSNQGLNAGDCDFFDIADPCGKGGENKNLGSGFFFRYVLAFALSSSLDRFANDGLVLTRMTDSVRRPNPLVTCTSWRRM